MEKRNEQTAEKQPDNRPYLVYLWNSYQVSVSDAYAWARKNGYDPDRDFREVLSEHVFWVYMHKGLLENKSVLFVKDQQPK